MSFIRAKEIPPCSGNWYDYEVRGVREGRHVRQKVMRYIRKHSTGTPHLSVSHIGTVLTPSIPEPTARKS